MSPPLGKVLRASWVFTASALPVIRTAEAGIHYYR